MSAATDYLENKLADLILRGGTFAAPAKTFVALHTSTPNEAASGEVATSAWPSYARQDAAKGGAQSAAWTSPADGVCRNTQQLIYAMYDGAAAMTVTHFSLWDAATGGNPLVVGQLASSKTINNGDVFVIDVNKLTIQVM